MSDETIDDRIEEFDDDNDHEDNFGEESEIEEHKEDNDEFHSYLNRR